MASSNEYGEALKGVGPIPPKQGIYEMSETAKAELGTRLAFGDGRIFRYSKAGATALAPGKICKVGTVTESGLTNKAVAATVTAGSKLVYLTTSRACTTCEEGYLVINDVDGEGIIYKIRKAAANATTTTSTDITLYDPIATALTTSSEGTIIYNPYEQIEVIAAITNTLIGVPPITVTAEYYFWLQTWGMCPILSDGVPAAGVQVQASVAPAASLGGTTTYAAGPMPIGMQIELGVNLEYKLVYLMITP